MTGVFGYLRLLAALAYVAACVWAGVLAGGPS